MLQGAFTAKNATSFALDFRSLAAFCISLFGWSLQNIKLKWIL